MAIALLDPAVQVRSAACSLLAQVIEAAELRNFPITTFEDEKNLQMNGIAKVVHMLHVVLQLLLKKDAEKNTSLVLSCLSQVVQHVPYGKFKAGLLETTMT